MEKWRPHEQRKANNKEIYSFLCAENMINAFTTNWKCMFFHSLCFFRFFSLRKWLSITNVVPKFWWYTTQVCLLYSFVRHSLNVRKIWLVLVILFVGLEVLKINAIALFSYQCHGVTLRPVKSQSLTHSQFVSFSHILFTFFSYSPFIRIEKRFSSRTAYMETPN